MTDGNAGTGSDAKAVASPPLAEPPRVDMSPEIVSVEESVELDSSAAIDSVKASSSQAPLVTVSSVPETVPASPLLTYPAIKDFAHQALEKLQFRKKSRLDKIVELAQKKGSIVNNDVEMLLKVSDATATRYLHELVEKGRLKRTGAQKRPQYEPATGSNRAV